MRPTRRQSHNRKKCPDLDMSTNTIMNTDPNQSGSSVPAQSPIQLRKRGRPSDRKLEDLNLHYPHRKLRPRRITSNYYPQRKKRKKYLLRDITKKSSSSSSTNNNKSCTYSIKIQENHNNAMLEEEEDDDDDRVDDGDDRDDNDDDDDGEEEDEDDDEQQTRRYPVRNRKNTIVYQVENLHNNSNNNNHGVQQHQRNWLAGTGYHKERRSRQLKSKHRKNLEHRGSSSSSSTSSSSSSSKSRIYDRSFYNRDTIRQSWHNRWHCSSTKENNIPSTVDKDEKRFQRRINKSIIHARSELMPINSHQLGYENKSTVGNRNISSTYLADIEPMSIDSSVGFEQVGGHEKHILALKESIILPLMYPEVFSKFNVDPPRGVLFSGPPGTGKTLLARALANECSRLAQGSNNSTTTTTTTTVKHCRPIAFFMRKGADCLSKWVGESERQLRLLFDQAYRMRPSVIFFDEIDGLAPVRSSKQDQIHSSIVSTLLSLMDGLDNRAEVVIIGATNRPDAIDPALRRPGRFDREFVFTLPTEVVRRRILDVITAKWDPKPDSLLLDQIAAVTINFSGADLKALTTEACLCCLRRCYPQVYSSQVKLALEHKYLVVSHSDWFEALQIVHASSERFDNDISTSNLTPSTNALAATIRTPLSPILDKLLSRHVNKIVNYITRILLLTNSRRFDSLSNNNKEPSILSSPSTGNVYDNVSSCIIKSKLFIHGNISEIIMNAVWHKLEALNVFTLNLANLYAFPTSLGICPEAAIAQIITSIRRILNNTSITTFNMKCQSINGIVIVYIPSIDILFQSLPQLTTTYLIDRLNALIDEINGELNYIPLTLINSDPLEGSLNNNNNNNRLHYATMKHSRRLILIGTCTQSQQQYSSCFPPRIVPPINMEKCNSPIKQCNTATTTTTNNNSNNYNNNTNTNTTHDHCVSIFPNLIGKSNDVQCRGVTSDINLIDKCITSSHSLHLRSSPSSIVPTTMHNNNNDNNNNNNGTTTTTTTTTTVGSNEHLMKYTYDHNLNRINFQFTIQLPECQKSSFINTDNHNNKGNTTYNTTNIHDPCNPPNNKGNTTHTHDPSNPHHSILDYTDIDNDSLLCNPLHINHILYKIFNHNHTEFIHLELPNKEDRLLFFTSVIIKWPQLTLIELLDIRNNKSIQQLSDIQIPTPQPAVEKDDDEVSGKYKKDHYPVNLSPEELAIIESREMQLFRRLRQILRRVVAHLASFRRFAVFTRPVQLDEAPDYYDVIKQPIDLGLIRDKIDSHQYTNVTDFMKDIELVYQNALEYNPPNIPRSRDIRSRASEFWDEACLRMEEELQPVDLNELCEEANQARASRLSHAQLTKNPSTSMSHSKIKGSEHQHLKGTDRTSQQKPSLPLPQGNRYSRRLHGESPILELSDIRQLQSSNRRRRTISPNSSLKSPSKLQSSEIDCDVDVWSSPGPALIKSFEENEYDSYQLTLNGQSSDIFKSSPSEDSCNRLRSSPKCHDLQSFNQTPSPTLNITVNTPPPPPHPTTTTTITSTTTTAINNNPNCTTIQVDLKKLNHFLNEIVLQTDGWPTSQLINLHTDFSNLIFCKYAHVTNRMSLSDDFEKIFAIHQNVHF
ncbi:hypothetical protein Smp_179290 [Schistosoma mansoni]|uniref:hypothetical protein n=1 Tax=Schistosoma mansoni TaxID=6183 RepID=UPI00022DC2EE|nr:hypothetical protein Smp_179290 [Schistosoma mansoni]|eukprot:XP_018652886.1 hypothetical protein Smp_179290 [Schistosoma mansoni]